MFNPKIGDTMLRITPPQNGRAGYSQAGRVDAITEQTIELVVQVDIPRRMVFNRTDGFDTSGIGSFIVQPDFLA